MKYDEVPIIFIALLNNYLIYLKFKISGLEFHSFWVNSLQTKVI